MTHTPSPTPAIIHHIHAQLVHALTHQWGQLRPTRRLEHAFGVTDTTTYMDLSLGCSPRLFDLYHDHNLARYFLGPVKLTIHTTPHPFSPLVMGEVFRRLLDRSLTLGDVLDPPPPPPPMPASTIPRSPLFHMEGIDLYNSALDV